MLFCIQAQTIIDKQIVTFVELKGAYVHLDLLSAVLDTKTGPSKLVYFHLS